MSFLMPVMVVVVVVIVLMMVVLQTFVIAGANRNEEQ